MAGSDTWISSTTFINSTTGSNEVSTGGALHVQFRSTATLDNVIIVNCSSCTSLLLSPAGDGGAISGVSNATLVIRNSQISGCSSLDAAGIFLRLVNLYLTNI